MTAGSAIEEPAAGAESRRPGSSQWSKLVGRPLSPRAVFWLSLGLLWLVTGLWSVANPLMAGLDEPAHATKAAAVIRGQFIGAPLPDALAAADHLDKAQQDGRSVVTVTILFYQLPGMPYCFAFQSDVPAFCQPAITGDPNAASTAVTSAARYNPLYYAIVGLPSLLPSSLSTLYLMRLLSALMASILIASALRTVAEMKHSEWPMLAVVVTITPMVVFMCSTINPQCPELAGGLAIWITLLAILRDPDPSLLPRRCVRLTVATTLFVNSRGLSPFFLAIILIAVIACSPWRNVTAVVKDRRTWPYIGLCALATAAALAWIKLAGSLTSSSTVNYPEYADAETILKLTINNTSDYIKQTLGLFGWLDTPLPEWTYLVIAALLLMVVQAGFAIGRWTDRAVMLVVAGVVLALPIVSHYLQARYVGLFWQGRYILPVAFGVPLIAGFVLREPLQQLPPWMARRLQATLLLVVVTVQVFAFTVNLHRYINGWNGSWFATADNSWVPPLNPVLLVVAAAVGWLLLAAVVLRGVQSLVPAESETAPRTPVAGLG